MTLDGPEQQTSNKPMEEQNLFEKDKKGQSDSEEVLSPSPGKKKRKNDK